MNILFCIGHPAQVHFFKNIICSLINNGHNCIITVINKDVAIQLLKSYGFSYLAIGNEKTSLFAKAKELFKIEYRLLKIANQFNPDILVGGTGNVYVTHIGKLINKPSLVFDDTEHAFIEHILLDPFASIICTPSCFRRNIGMNQITYNGFHQLAYLHSNYFKPNPDVLSELGLSEREQFIVLRFVSWNASHDIGHHGINDKIKLIKNLESYGRVLITAESSLGKDLEKYRVQIPAEKLLSLLYYSHLYVGDGGSTALEAAVLGTHSIYVSTLGKLCGVFSDIGKYNLLWTFDNETDAIIKAKELLRDCDLWKTGKEKRCALINDKIDVTNFAVNLIERHASGLNSSSFRDNFK